jgi:predicted acetyltransferase
LGQTLNEARARGLEYVELTTTPDNLPSQKVIEANGGRLVARVTRGRELGGGDALLYRIMLASIEKASA